MALSAFGTVLAFDPLVVRLHIEIADVDEALLYRTDRDVITLDDEKAAPLVRESELQAGPAIFGSAIGARQLFPDGPDFPYVVRRYRE